METLNYGQQSNKTLNDWLWDLADENNENLVVEIRNNDELVARFEGSFALQSNYTFNDMYLRSLVVKYVGVYKNLVKINMKQD